ncbi:MAG: alpha/beta hydrolase [Cohaesibacter sp.]|nr:alpha/beta hydrolase [Cohaesibacter sp.]
MLSFKTRSNEASIQSRLRHWILAFSCLWIALFSAAQAEDSHTPLEPLECPGTRPQGEAAACFILHLPADWSKISGRSIEVPVMRFAPTGDLEAAQKAAKPPLLVLLGGPGQSAIYLEKILLRRLAYLRKDRELILMDQRGTGPFNTGLACEEAIDDKDRVQFSALKACAKDAMEAGYRLEDYSTMAAARDYRALRYALKIDKWSVIATSYGARVAQKLLEIDEKGIDRLILNSPHLIEALLFDWSPFPLVEKVMDACNEDDRCREAYPELYWDFQTLKFNMQKVELAKDALPHLEKDRQAAGDQAQKEESNEALSNGEKEQASKILLYHLYRQRLQALLARHRAGEVPRDIWRTAQSLDQALASESPWSPPKPLTSNMKKISLLMHYTVFCQEDGERMRKKGFETIPQQLYVQFYRKVCELLDGPSLEKGWDKAKKSKKPLLLLSGDLDTVIDPESPKKVQKRYPNMQWIRFPNAGHDVANRNACARKLVADYLEHKELQKDCVLDGALHFSANQEQAHAQSSGKAEAK